MMTPFYIFQDVQKSFIMSLRGCSIFLILALGSGPASALDRTSIIFTQDTLNKHGFDAGKSDGKLGPATRRALVGFSDKYGAPNDIEGAMNFMINNSVKGRKEVTSESELKQVKERIAENLRDPSSVTIRNIYKVVDYDTDLICGEVNGKNAYGAYAGFTKFYGLYASYTGFEFFPILIDDATSAVAELKCLFAFPRKF